MRPPHLDFPNIRQQGHACKAHTAWPSIVGHACKDVHVVVSDRCVRSDGDVPHICWQVERSELSQKLKQYTRMGPPPSDGAAGPSDAKTQDSGSEVLAADPISSYASCCTSSTLCIGESLVHHFVRGTRLCSGDSHDLAAVRFHRTCRHLMHGVILQQQMQSQQTPTAQERVLTLSVPAGRERHLTGSDIKKLSWNEYIQLYEVGTSARLPSSSPYLPTHFASSSPFHRQR